MDILNEAKKNFDYMVREGSTDAVCMTHLLDLIFCETCEFRNHIIREFDALCFL